MTNEETKSTYVLKGPGYAIASKQQNIYDLLRMWGKKTGEQWATAVLRYDNISERMKGFRWSLVDFNHEVFFKDSRMWRNCKNEKVSL